MCVYVYICVHTHTHTHTYIYIYMERDREVCFKDLAHMIVEAGEFEICREASRLETQERPDAAVLNLKAVWKQNSSGDLTLKTFNWLEEAH